MGPIMLLGSEAQKQRWLPALCRGEHIGCFGLTEPQAGSDAGATQTRGTRDNGDYVVSVDGTKVGDGKPGPMTLRLLAAFRDACRRSVTP